MSCCAPGFACTGACMKVGSGTALANGYCSLHGWWSGYGGCPSCSTAGSFTLEMRPEYLPLPALEPLPFTFPPEGFRLVDEAKLKRIAELFDELVALVADVVPD